MNLEYAQTVIGFDLDFLNEPSNNDVACEALRNQSHGVSLNDNSNKILQFDASQFQKKPNSSKNRRSEKGFSYLKKKIIDTNHLVEQYHARYDQIAKLEMNLVSTKDKLRDVCIEKDLIKQNYETLDKESDKLRNRNKELENIIIDNQHIHAATESHTRQLEQLLKERDTQIDGLKVDINLKKATIKELEKSLCFFRRYKEHLITQICNVADVVFTRRTLNKKEKITLFKYMRLKKQRAEGIEKTGFEEQYNNSDMNSCDDAVLSDSEDLTEGLCLLQDKTKEQHESHEEIGSKMNDFDADMDITSEVISVDTGRGSSLAFSGSEKNINSPEYYIDSPKSQSNAECYKHKEKCVDSATSPILIKHYVETGTSPCEQETNIEPEKSTPVRTVDIALSPMRFPDKVVSSDKSIDGIELLSSISEKSCLELNDSGNLIYDNTSDCEVEMILNTMKLNDSLITPIPPTPDRSAKSSTCHEHICDCPQAEKVTKDTEALQSAFVNLATEFSHIKKKVVNLENTLVSLDKQSELHRDLKSRCNIIEEQESVQKTDHDNMFENVSTSDNTPEFVQDTTPVLYKKLPQVSMQISQDISDNDLQSELEPNVNNEFSSEQGTDSASECFGNRDTEKKTATKKNKLGRLEKHVLKDTTPVLHKNLPQVSFQISQNISNNDLQSEVVANVYNKFSPEQRDTNRDTERRTVTKAKKLTRLEKLRKNLIPKSKIRKDLPPPRVLRSRIEKVSNTNCGIVNETDSALILNKKEAYEKAVKVMAVIKSQQKAVIPKRVINRKKSFVESVLNGQGSQQPNNQPKNMKSAVDKISKKKASSPDIVNNRLNSDQHNISVPVTDNKNHVSKARSNEKSVGSENERRRKSFPPEIESILTKSRKRYPSLSLNKYPVVLLMRSEESLAQGNNRVLCSAKKCLKRGSDNESESIHNNKVLHSSAQNREDTESNNNLNLQLDEKSECFEMSLSEPVLSDTSCKPVSYDDLDLFNDVPPAKKQKCQDVLTNCIQNPNESVLCKVIDDVGVTVFKHCPKKVPETVVSSITTKIGESIAAILELPQKESKKAMDKMIEKMEKWQFSDFIAGLMQYLMDPTRKLELLNKINAPPAPPMTKSEQILLYVVSRLRLHWQNRDVITCVLNQIEYTLFKLNQTPELKVVESMSHFYAILCRYINNKCRLRIFIVNAMYCMQYSAVALVKQCIEVWMHILPLAHMGLAKSPMVSTLVYLLHFYKCDDNTNMVQDIRNILKNKYFFHVTDWDETKILEMFKNAIMEISDNSFERKMLRLSLIILAKRHGTKWCQNKIINNMLLPLIATGDVPERVKAFCISMLGPLFKPYPEDMRVHCGIVVNQLIDILSKKPSPLIEEVTYTSLICLSKHNQNRVIQALLSWRPKRMTPYMESVLKDYVKERPVKVWKAILSKVPLTT